MISQLNPQRSVQKSKPNWGSLFIGSESDSGSSQLTRSSQLAAPGAVERARTRWTVGSPSNGPRLRIASPTRSRASHWMAIQRLGVIAFLSLSRGAAPAPASTAPWQGSSWAQQRVTSQRDSAGHLMLNVHRPRKSPAHLLPSPLAVAVAARTRASPSDAPRLLAAT